MKHFRIVREAQSNRPAGDERDSVATVQRKLDSPVTAVELSRERSDRDALTRWWAYQRERFPVATHGLLIAAFSYSAVCYSSLARGEAASPSAGSALVAFVSAFLLFLQLRIADEFKDFEDDSRYRPYRPVPRGLVSLRELGKLAVMAGVVQVLLAMWLKPSLVVLLVAIWIYVGLMKREFFVPAWIKSRPSVYIAAHMLVVPLIDFFATACDWNAAGEAMPGGLHWFLLVSYMNGVVLEIGRKIRAPEDEEPGVETYSFLWGRHRAVLVWVVALALTAVSAWRAADRIGFAAPVIALTMLLIPAGVATAAHFLRGPRRRSARTIEAFSGCWTLLLYLHLGVIPSLWR